MALRTARNKLVGKSALALLHRLILVRTTL
jgi:hypothetical protein